MMRAFPIAAVLVLASCGGEVSSPLVASFPMGPRQVRTAIYERFPDVLGPEESNWPTWAAPVDVELMIVRSAVVPVDGAVDISAHSPVVEPALLSVDLDAMPVDAVELLVGPGDAVDLNDERVRPIAHADVPKDRRENARLVFSFHGPTLLAKALSGTWAEQAGDKRVTLFLRGRALVSLRPGQQLPVSEADAHVLIDIPLRYRR